VRDDHQRQLIGRTGEIRQVRSSSAFARLLGHGRRRMVSINEGLGAVGPGTDALDLPGHGCPGAGPASIVLMSVIPLGEVRGDPS
jgi:hypothetical protein